MFKMNTYLFTGILSLAFLAVSCNDNSLTDHQFESEELTVLQKSESNANQSHHNSTSALLQDLKKATARYNSTTQAAKAGYMEDTHCVAHPDLGGMGYHWLNEELVDPLFDPLTPEVLVYEKDKNGNSKLVAVEYIVIDAGQPHPHFGDYPLDVGGTPVPVPHYSLHVWLYKDNPNGIFVPFNPDVSCS